MSPPARHCKTQNRHEYLLKGSELVAHWTWDGPAFGGVLVPYFWVLWFYKAVWLRMALRAAGIPLLKGRSQAIRTSPVPFYGVHQEGNKQEQGDQRFLGERIKTEYYENVIRTFTLCANFQNKLRKTNAKVLNSEPCNVGLPLLPRKSLKVLLERSLHPRLLPKSPKMPEVWVAEPPLRVVTAGGVCPLVEDLETTVWSG